jgi:tetratricopeptide (TPR) repeat protein
VWILRAIQLAVVEQPARDMLHFVSRVISLPGVYYLILLLVLFLCALTLAKVGTAGKIPYRLSSIVAYAVLPIFAFVFSTILNLRPVQADMIFFQAGREVESSSSLRYPHSLALFDQAASWSFSEDIYYASLGETAKNYAGIASGAEQKDDLYQYAVENVQKAYRLNPFYIGNITSLANVYRKWGDSTMDAGIKASRYSKTEYYYSTAVKMSPMRTDIWLEWAEFRFQMNDFSGAHEKIDHAISMEPTYPPAYSLSGKLYFFEAENQSDPSKRKALFEIALENFKQQIKWRSSTDTEQRFIGQAPVGFAYFDLGNTYAQLGKFELAIEAYLTALETGADEYHFDIYKQIANAYGALGDLSAQLNYLRKAIIIAPQDEKTVLQAQLDALIK